MSTTVDGATLDQWFKDIYKDGYVSLMPDNTKLIKMIPFNRRSMPGEKVKAGVVTQRSNGFTYGGTQNRAFTLITPEAMETRAAQVSPNQIVLREFVSMATATRAKDSKQAFGEAMSLVIENMMESFGNRLEISNLYGGIELATFTAKTTPVTNSLQLTIPASEWAVGLWCGMEGSLYNFYVGSTLLGGATPLSADSIGTLTAVDTENYKVTFSFTATGYAAVNGATITAVAAYFAGSYDMEQVGLHKITANTGTLFGINATEYSLWQSVQQSITGALTTGKLNRYIAKSVGKGLSEDIDCFVNPVTWTDLTQDVLAQRLFDSSYDQGKAVVGSKTLDFVSQSGKVSIIPHNMVKQGYAYAGPTKRLERIGSTDVTMANAGNNGERIFLNLPDNNGFELRAFSDQSLFTTKPGLFGQISGITNGV